ncbi:ras and Rab interactor 1-like [Antennarius striatus]|uniref:ras and Rab interactor 1-like n=1 Tax=Antennarius striatus TaxID=241820 RepID=UPI0035AE405F
MAQQEEPLYDFPEPTQSSERKFLGHQRSQGSLRSISVLDRLLLTVPVWLQLSINPATALHILQREPPGTFLVRKSRTSQTNVLCVRLADDSVPFFVQQFGIREEQSSKTLSLETSAVSFPDLPRLISFYCVSRDVLPFSLELPVAIARATSHKELESISHMGVEFWNSHLNFRGPREVPKPQKAEEEKADAVPSAVPAAAPQTGSSTMLDLVPQPDLERLKVEPQSENANKQSVHNPTVFHEFCPITTRSPRQLDCGSGQGALCFINPLFLQSQGTLCRQRMFKRSIKVRISTETSTMLSPPLSPPPPPPVMPKSKGKCKALKKVPSQTAELAPIDQDFQSLMQTLNASSETRVQTAPTTPPFQPGMQEQGQPEQSSVAAVKEQPADMSDYMQPSPMVNISHPPLMSAYLTPSACPMLSNILPKTSPSHSPLDSPAASPPTSPSPSLSPKVPCTFFPFVLPNASPSLSPYQSPSPSPKVPLSLSPFYSPILSQLTEQAYHTPAAVSRSDQERSEREDGEEEAGTHENEDEGDETCEEGLVLQMNAVTMV